MAHWREEKKKNPLPLTKTDANQSSRRCVDVLKSQAAASRPGPSQKRCREIARCACSFTRLLAGDDGQPDGVQLAAGVLTPGVSNDPQLSGCVCVLEFSPLLGGEFEVSVILLLPSLADDEVHFERDAQPSLSSPLA